MMPAPASLLVDGRAAPLGVGALPEFAWSISGDSAQVAYELEVDGSDGAPVWRSGRVEDHRPFGAVYGGPPLTWNSAYHWRVRVHDDSGAPSPWSGTTTFETGILDQGQWRASWISAPAAGKKDRRTLYFRRDVELSAPVVRARAFASALGWYRLRVNDVDVTGYSRVPRWTPYDESVEYQVYDVTDAFTTGTNRVGMIVADGRYRGRMGFLNRDARYGDRLGVSVQVLLDLADGTSVVVVTDERWAVGEGRVRTGDPKTGERVDLRISDDGWMAGGALEAQQQAVRLPPHGRALIGEQVARVDRIASLPGSVRRTPSGAQLVDFGQNIAGVARIRLGGPSGSTARLLYGEILTDDGELNTGYLGSQHPERQDPDWFQRDEAVLAGEPVDYLPSFTVHGFRYVAVEGADPLSDDDVEAVVLSSDLPQTARFTSSDARLERLWQNALWSLRSNFTDTATDCPTRERSGWTGDAQVFGPTAVQLVAADGFFRRYLRNAAVEQRADGTMPPYVPAERSAGRGWDPIALTRTSVGWGDVLVMLPWTLYEYYGDEAVLRAQYASAKAWVDQLAHRAATRHGLVRRFGPRVGALERYIVDTGRHWGEWLRPDDTGTDALKDLVLRAPAVVATAYFANSARLLSRIAAVIGRDDDAVGYAVLADEVAIAWRAAFVHDGGSRIGFDKQDDYVRALAFGLLPEAQRPAAARRLVELIEAAGDHLGTGFLSTPMLLGVLADSGHEDVAYRLLLQTTAPSWLGQVEQGATSIWETWSGRNEDGVASGSYNHYAFGSVVRFLHERVAGIAPAEPGYRRIRFAPLVTDRLDAAGAALETPFGPASSRWHRDGGTVILEIHVPAGSTAEVVVPGEPVPREAAAGDHVITWSEATD